MKPVTTTLNPVKATGKSVFIAGKPDKPDRKEVFTGTYRVKTVRNRVKVSFKPDNPARRPVLSAVMLVFMISKLTGTVSWRVTMPFKLEAAPSTPFGKATEVNPS